MSQNIRTKRWTKHVIPRWTDYPSWLILGLEYDLPPSGPMQLSPVSCQSDKVTAFWTASPVGLKTGAVSALSSKMIWWTLSWGIWYALMHVMTFINWSDTIGAVLFWWHCFAGVVTYLMWNWAHWINHPNFGWGQVSCGLFRHLFQIWKSSLCHHPCLRFEQKSYVDKTTHHWHPKNHFEEGPSQRAGHRSNLSPNPWATARARQLLGLDQRCGGHGNLFKSSNSSLRTRLFIVYNFYISKKKRANCSTYYNVL